MTTRVYHGPHVTGAAVSTADASAAVAWCSGGGGSSSHSDGGSVVSVSVATCLDVVVAKGPHPSTHHAPSATPCTGPPPSTTQGACANVHMRNAGASTCIKCTHGQYQQATRSRIRCICSREFLDQCQLNLFASGGQLLESEHGMRMHSVIVSVYFIVLPVAITTSRVSCACKADRSLVCLALYS
jgi:hypothetical protein